MSDFQFGEQKATSLRHKITDDIRKAIFKGKLKPGDRLRETEMAKQMGVSRGPVREAMRMLEQEGVLYSQPYKETMVADITSEEVLEVLIPIRLTLELFAIRKALPHITPHHLDQLAEWIADMKSAADEQDLYKLVDADLAFHGYLVNLSKASNLIGIWTTIFNRIRLHFIVQGQAYSDLNLLLRSHEELLRTIREGDLSAITAELTRHIHDVRFD